jgi:hypothetical protein
LNSSRRISLGRLALARWSQIMGWPGSLGLFSIVIAAAWSAWTWSQFDVLALQAASTKVDLLQVAPAGERSASAAQRIEQGPPLLRSVDSAKALAGIQTLLTAHGLQVQSADYRLQKATATQPASLDIQLSAKASYLQIRSALIQVVSTTPGLSLRQLTLSRANAETGELDSKIGLALYLAPDARVAGGSP